MAAIQPLTDMRRIRLIEDEFGHHYTVTSGSICQFCGFMNRCQITHLNTDQPSREIENCEVFRLVIKFAPPIMGLLGHFNTLRLGSALKRRLRAGTIVTLMHAKTGELLGDAEVTNIKHGDKEAIIRAHSINNHSIIGLGIRDQDKAAETMLDRLPKRYGKHIYRTYDDATAVYMRLLDDTETNRRSRL